MRYIRRRLKTEIKTEVIMLRDVEFWMLVKRTTRAWEASKMVWRQVNAIVKPRVIMIKRRSCRRNSF